MVHLAVGVAACSQRRRLAKVIEGLVPTLLVGPQTAELLQAAGDAA
jgi:hypothetical protein